ncbi:MAG: hypothetical protein WBO24_11885 [Nitrospirales bacterium]
MQPHEQPNRQPLAAPIRLQRAKSFDTLGPRNLLREAIQLMTAIQQIVQLVAKEVFLWGDRRGQGPHTQSFRKRIEPQDFWRLYTTANLK